MKLNNMKFLKKTCIPISRIDSSDFRVYSRDYMVDSAECCLSGFLINQGGTYG